MKANEITIEVKAKLDVSRSTAEGCLKLVEIYLNEHPDIRVKVERTEDGSESYSFVDKERCSYDASNNDRR